MLQLTKNPGQTIFKATTFISIAAAAAAVTAAAATTAVAAATAAIAAAAAVIAVVATAANNKPWCFFKPTTIAQLPLVRLTKNPDDVYFLVIFVVGLKKLRLSFNDLNVLDSRIDELGKLEEITLEGNNLKKPPQHVLAQGVEKLYEYMDALKAVSQSATKVSPCCSCGCYGRLKRFTF